MPLSSRTTVPDDVFRSVSVYVRGYLMCFQSFVFGEPPKSKDVLFHLRHMRLIACMLQMTNFIMSNGSLAVVCP